MKGFALHVIHETIAAEEQMWLEIFASLPDEVNYDASEEDARLFEDYK